ncbi:unnamed protein product, partial [Tenebrio molitor]
LIEIEEQTPWCSRWQWQNAIKFLVGDAVLNVKNLQIRLQIEAHVSVKQYAKTKEK